MKLTELHLTVLEKACRQGKRHYRLEIDYYWRSGFHCPYLDTDERAALRQLRNHLGPEWLAAYRPGDTQVGWLAATQMEVGTGKPGYRWAPAYKIVDDDGTDLVQPYCRRKVDAREVARQLKITLIEEPK